MPTSFIRTRRCDAPEARDYDLAASANERSQAYTGSNRTFAALLHAMSKKDKVGFGVFQPRKNSTPQLVAMLSQVS